MKFMQKITKIFACILIIQASFLTAERQTKLMTSEQIDIINKTKESDEKILELQVDDLLGEKSEKALVKNLAQAINKKSDLRDLLPEINVYERVYPMIFIPSVNLFRYDNGDTLFDRAIANDNVLAVKFLISLGADINVQNETGWTPINTAVYYHDLENFNLILSQQPDCNLANNAGQTPLHTVIIRASGSRFFVDYYKMAQKLTTGFVDLDLQDNHGRTALHNAVMFNNFDIVKLFLEKGAEIKILDDQGDRALDYVKNTEMEELFAKTMAYHQGIVLWSSDQFRA